MQQDNRYLVGNPRAALRFRRQEHVDNHSIRRQRFRRRSSLEEKHDRYGCTIWQSHIASLMDTAELDSLSVGGAQFYAVVKESQVGLSLRSIFMVLVIPMIVEMQSDSSTANSLTYRFGSRTHFVSRFEKKQKSKLDDEIKLSGLEALVQDELEKHLIFNSNLLRTFEDVLLEVVTYAEAKFGLRIRDARPGEATARLSCVGQMKIVDEPKWRVLHMRRCSLSTRLQCTQRQEQAIVWQRQTDW